jgi:hypothetical protein
VKPRSFCPWLIPERGSCILSPSKRLRGTGAPGVTPPCAAPKCPRPASPPHPPGTARTAAPGEGTGARETYSESQSDRAVLAFRGPAGQAATVIVLRRHNRVWLVFDGAEKTTVAMSDPQATQLVAAITAASRGSR